MFPTFSSRRTGVRAAVSDAKDDALQAMTDAKDAVTGATQRAVDALDASRKAAAGHLESAAELGHATAKRLDRTADYIRRRPMRRMWSDLAAVAMDNPGPSLVLAAVAGFFVGRAFTRS